MTLYLLLCIFLISVFLTFTFTMVLKNRGPWNNPMLFFLIHFLTSWSIVLWSDPVILNGKSYPFVTGTAIAFLIAVLLAATRTVKADLEKIRRLKDNQIVEVVTKPKEHQARAIPNRYYWGLVVFESLMIMAAYLLKYIN